MIRPQRCWPTRLDVETASDTPIDDELYVSVVGHAFKDVGWHVHTEFLATVLSTRLAFESQAQTRNAQKAPSRSSGYYGLRALAVGVLGLEYE